MAKKRLDHILVERGLAPSRGRAQALILSRSVYVDGQPKDKAGTMVPEAACITIKGRDHPYVGRGGLKLEAALNAFGVLVEGLVCIDVGAATGGFTDCLLRRGAARVIAIDVGYGQLAWKLRQDPRVVAMERVNIRTVVPEAFPERASLAVIDVSFISLKLVVPPVLGLLESRARILALIKPQFEVGKGQVGKGGVVRSAEKHQRVVDELVVFFETMDLVCEGLMACPILGPKGNREFFALLGHSAQ